MSKDSAYLIKFDAEINSSFQKIADKLGWNKSATIFKLVRLFSEVINQMRSNSELVILARDSKTKDVIVERINSFEGLKN
jgi:hypothetical protein